VLADSNQITAFHRVGMGAVNLIETARPTNSLAFFFSTTGVYNPVHNLCLSPNGHLESAAYVHLTKK
jgi:hypothetical protein